LVALDKIHAWGATPRAPQQQSARLQQKVADHNMEAFNEPVRQLIKDISAFGSTADSITGSDRADVLTSFRSFVGAVEALSEHLRCQSRRDKIASAPTSHEVATTMSIQKADLLLRSKHMTKVADDAVASIKRLKRLALDLQYRACKLREAINEERVKSTQKSKTDQAQLTRIGKELEKCFASINEANAKLHKLEEDVGKAEDARTTMRVVSEMRSPKQPSVSNVMLITPT
jgi:hypothetical protein